MTLKYADGFDSYAATTDLAKKGWSYTTPWAWSSTAGRNGGGGLVCTTSTGTLTSRNPLLGGVGQAYIGFWFKASAAPSSTLTFFRFISTAGTAFGNTQLVTSTGQIRLESIGSSSTGARNICDNQWHWIELDYRYGSSTIFFTIYVDNTLELFYTWGISVTNMDYFQFFGVTGSTIYLDDIMLWDTAGSTFSSAYFPFGAREFSTLRPSADGTVQFTPSTGSSNYALVNEVNGSIATYVEDRTSGHQDLYDYDNLGGTPTYVNAMLQNTYLHNPHIGSINHQVVAKSGATTLAGTSTVTPALQTTLQTIYDRDPNGTILWTPTAIDAMQLGIKVP